MQKNASLQPFSILKAIRNKKLLKPLYRLFLLFGILYPAKNPAQEVYISNPISLRTSVNYQLISPRRGGLLLLKDNLSTFQIIGFDEQLQQSWEKELVLDRRRPQIIQTISHENGFSILYIYRKENNSFLKIHRYNAAANLTDSLTIASLPGTVYEFNLKTAVSEDRKKLLLYQLKNQGKIWALAFDLEQIEKLWTWETIIDAINPARFFFDFLIDNKSNAYLLVEKNNRKAKLDQHHLQIFQFGPSTNFQQREFTIPMFNHLHSSQQYLYDNVHQQLVGGGLYAAENTNRTKGSFFLRYPFKANDTQTQQITLTYQPYPKELLTKLSPRNNNQKDLTYAHIKHIVLRQDGGALLTFERSHFFERNQSLSNPHSARFVDRFATDYYFDEVFSISYAPDGQLDWYNILHKKQYSQNDEGAFSSFFPATTTARVLLLFNDEIRSENTVSAYEIFSNGTAQRKTIFNTQHLQLQLLFTKAIQINTREIIIPSEKRNVLKLVKVVL